MLSLVFLFFFVYLLLSLVFFLQISSLLLSLLILEIFSMYIMWFFSVSWIFLNFKGSIFVVIFSVFVLESIVGIVGFLNFLNFFGSDYLNNCLIFR